MAVTWLDKPGNRDYLTDENTPIPCHLGSWQS